jgi:uncharacterized membrane protein YjfL (UPF0719 family)
MRRFLLQGLCISFATPPPIGAVMQQLAIVGMNILYAVLGVVLMFLSIRVFDHLTKLDLEEELRKGNIAVGIFVAALFISIALIIGRALS